MYKLICHRGIHNKNIKENSYESINNALNNSEYVGVEFDIRSTLDNELILFHNPMYNNRLISKTNYSELPKYVPKLEDILSIQSNKIFLIEIKNIENNYDKFFDIMYKYSNKNIYVMSFSNNIIKKINKDNRTYKIGVLNYILNTNEDIKELDFVGILNGFITDEVKNKLKNKEIFSYGLFEIKKYKDIYYIVDN